MTRLPARLGRVQLLLRPDAVLVRVETVELVGGAGLGGRDELVECECPALVLVELLVGGNRKDAAVRLGIGLRTLYDKLKRYRLD